MDFYKRGFQLDNIDIPDYTNPKHPTNPPAKRKPHAQPGMSELVNIVAGHQKDVKSINACLTKQGALEYLAKNKKMVGMLGMVILQDLMVYITVFLKSLLLIVKEISKL